LIKQKFVIFSKLLLLNRFGNCKLKENAEKKKEKKTNSGSE